MKKALSVLVFLLVISTVAMAEEYTCIDDSTSQYETTIIVSGSGIPITYNETCKFGCNTASGKCDADPYEDNTGLIGITFSLFALGVILILLSFRVDQDGFKHFYYFSGLLFLLAGLVTVQIYVQNTNKTSVLGYIDGLLWFLIVIFAFSLLLLFFLILYDLAKLMQEKGVGGMIKDKLGT